MMRPKDLVRYSYVLRKDGSEKIDVFVRFNFSYIAPVLENTVVGSYSILLNNTVLETGNIYLKTQIPRRDLNFYLKLFLSKWLMQ